MDIDDELASLGRIIVCIKEYRRQTADYYDLFNNKSIDQYLENHLIMADYLFWQYLQVDERASLNLSTSDSKDRLSLQQFKLLLREYKRGVFEKFYQFWSQPKE